MFQPYFDLNTLFLYIAIGLSIVFLIRMNVKSKRKNNSYFILFVVLLIFSISRKVGFCLGGMDSLSYENIFLIRDYGRFLENKEYLFVYFTDLIRGFTTDTVVYRCFCYSLIIVSYINFIKEFCPKKASSIPFLLIMYPLLMSFNTMRNSMAMAIILLGLVLIKKKKDIMGVALVVSSIFFHRMSMIYLPIILFYYVLRKKIIFKTKISFALLIIISLVLSSIVGKLFQSYVISAGLVDGNDAYYLGMNKGNSFLSALSYFIPLLLISAFMCINSHKKMVEKYKFLYLIVLYDIIIFPCTVTFGMWRANEYMYIPRLIMWAILISSFCQKYSFRSRLIIKIIFLIFFILWFINRLEGIYADAALMPYVLNWL